MLALSQEAAAGAGVSRKWRRLVRLRLTDQTLDRSTDKVQKSLWLLRARRNCAWQQKRPRPRRLAKRLKLGCSAGSANPAPVLTMNSQKKYGGLTEAEIPTSRNRKRVRALAFFREKLVELRDNILHNATGIPASTCAIPGGTDPVRRATPGRGIHPLSCAPVTASALFKAIGRQVLRMVDDGSFGWCEASASRSLHTPGLRVRPRRSIEAQERCEHAETV